MYLYLVRHGQSVGNEQRLFFGWSDHPLTGLGREQARQAAEKLREVTFTRCVSSDLSRAWDTALICAGGRGMEVEADSRLREQDMGGLEDAGWEKSHELYGDLIDRMVADWPHVDPPGGESVGHMKERVGAAINEIVERGEDTLIVAHNGSLSLILSHFGLAVETELMNPAYGWYFNHGAYSAIEIKDGAARLAVFNR